MVAQRDVKTECDCERLDEWVRTGLVHHCHWVAYESQSDATSLDGLESLAAAKRLVKQIHATLSSLPQRQRPESPRTSRAHQREEKSQGSSTLSQAWKYVCTGAGGQYNTVQEGNGHQTVTNAHKMYGYAKRSG